MRSRLPVAARTVDFRPFEISSPDQLHSPFDFAGLTDVATEVLHKSIWNPCNSASRAISLIGYQTPMCIIKVPIAIIH
jgi:hypothetical protein